MGKSFVTVLRAIRPWWPTHGGVKRTVLALVKLLQPAEVESVMVKITKNGLANGKRDAALGVAEFDRRK